MTPEKQRIAIARACGKQVLPIAEESLFYKKFAWLNSYVKECRLAGKDVDGNFWDKVKLDILDGGFPYTLIDGRSSRKLQYLEKGWVHTTAQNPLGLWILGGCSQAFDREPKPEEGREGFTVQVWCAKDVPEYLNDVNAVREAVQFVPPLLRADYARHLARLVGGKLYEVFEDDDMLFAFVNATAAQRAEAFLRTLNLWVED